MNKQLAACIYLLEPSLRSRFIESVIRSMDLQTARKFKKACYEGYGIRSYIRAELLNR